jgi:hypothetical protein
MRHRRSHSASHKRCGDVDFLLSGRNFFCTRHEHISTHSLSRNFIFWPLCEKSTGHSTLNFEATGDFLPGPAVCYATREHLTSRAETGRSLLSLNFVRPHF